MKTIIFVLMFFVASTVAAQIVDLHKLTLNGSALKELTVEKATNIFGRPSVVEKNELMSDIIGPIVYYHNKGLMFWFKSKKEDPQQRIMVIAVYLSKKWDDKNKEWYLPYAGIITPRLNRNMKVNDILPPFKNYKVEVMTGEERRKDGETRYAGTGANINLMQEDIISVQNKGYCINIFCEELTKFLEYISITFDDPQQ